ncbi:Fic family protein [Candidatus Pacearchaeota archaeon]|nr:Fic family protein [Candidatus Pacearchaeota archaeon]
MVYTEIKDVKGKRYYYRVKSIRKDGKVKKERIYLGKNLKKEALSKAEKEADKELVLLSSLLSDEEIKILQKIKTQFSKEPEQNFENRYENFCALFTYDSTAIEGNTLTLQETAMLLFENITPRKSMREINETLNHKKAFDFILGYKWDITKQFILHLHEIVVQNTLRKDIENQIGKYRDVQVYITGTKWIPPKPSELPNEIRKLLFWYSKNKDKLHPVILAAYFHVAFEGAHPFIDGNGRVGRLLMNFILYKNKYPMINIPNSIKHKYYDSLEEAHLNGNLKPFIEFLVYLLKNREINF